MNIQKLIGSQPPSTTTCFPLKDLAARLTDPVDVFLTCCSFEDRCLSVPQSLPREQVTKSVAFFNQTLEASMWDQVKFFRQDWKAELIPIRLDDPIYSEDQIATTLADLEELASESPKHCVIDISTFPREILLILINRIHHTIPTTTKISLVYTHAKSYSKGSEPHQKWLTRGVREIRSVAGFPGEIFPSRPTHLIVLGGYESDRAIQLVEQYEPRFLSVGYPPLSGSVSAQMHEEAQFFKKRVTTFFDDINEFEFAAIDPFEASQAIWKQAQKFERANVVVAPLNTKISTVGAALAALAHPEIQLCYAQGEIYNYAGYSEPSEECSLIESLEIGVPGGEGN